MKFTLTILVILLVSVLSRSAHHKKMSAKHHRMLTEREKAARAAKSTSKSQSKTKVPTHRLGTNVLPVTPKGEQLDNHFGSQTETSPYGPQPTLVSQEATIHDQYGKESHKLLWHTIHTPIGYADQCKLSEMDNYELCLVIQDCDFCAANIHCGWCEATGRCMPGDKSYAVCPTACVNGWIYDAQSCTGKVYSGMFSNIAPEATGFITPEQAQPKQYVRTLLHHQAVVSTPVVLGTKRTQHEVTRTNPFSGVDVSHDSYETQTPIVGQVHQVMNVATSHDQFIDTASGKRLDLPEPHTMHGWTQYDQQHTKKKKKMKKM